MAYFVDIISDPVIAIKLSYNGLNYMWLICILIVPTFDGFTVNFLLYFLVLVDLHRQDLLCIVLLKDIDLQNLRCYDLNVFSNVLMHLIIAITVWPIFFFFFRIYHFNLSII